MRHKGWWAEPDVTHVRALPRYVYEHCEKASQRGRRAAARLRREWTWDQAARRLVAALDALVAGAPPT